MDVSSEDPTKRQRRVAAIVALSQDMKQVDACLRYAEKLDIYFRQCDPENAATTIAHWRPFALLVDGGLYDAAPERYEVLAREVGASLLRLPEQRMGQVLAAI